MSVEVFDDHPCLLGEGPLWHPGRGQLFWFDILGKRLFARSGPRRFEWRFDRHASAAGWVDDETLLIATERNLIRFDIATGSEDVVAPLEAETPLTRSNDGRADPYGGFWIGTMGKQAEPRAGAIYRYYRGEVRCLFDKITVSNAICFTPDGDHAYFADTAQRLVWRVALDGEGWPKGDPEVFLNHRETGLNTDGAIVDAEGGFVCAEWGAWRVARYSPTGGLIEEFALPVEQPSCPALDGGTLYVTSARQGLPGSEMADQPEAGMTFAIDTSLTGQVEHQVIL